MAHSRKVHLPQLRRGVIKRANIRSHERKKRKAHPRQRPLPTLQNRSLHSGTPRRKLCIVACYRTVSFYNRTTPKMTEAQKTILLAKPYGELKKLAWSTFSEYIRRRAADWKGSVICVTCGKQAHWKDGMQAGHFIPGRNNSILFDERGVHVQCVGCNYFGKGAHTAYRKFMEKKYGIKVINELEKKARKTVTFDKKDLIKMIDSWVAKLKKLET